VSASDSPAARGFRWPAEWEPHAGTWFTWPHNPETWPGHLEGAARAFAEMTRALQGRETVNVVVADDPAEARARAQLAAAGVDADRGIRFRRIRTDDGWMRDCGPLIVVRDSGGRRERAGVDFRFNAWGGKYPPFDLDDAAGAAVCAALGLPVVRSELVLEGGSIDGDGRGTVLTTEQCLLHPNRGAGRAREGLERALADLLGAREVLWLAGGIEGDDTDGHVDDIARFVAPGTVVAVAEPIASDANAAPLAENLRRLRAMRDADGKPLAVVELPMPPPLFAEGLRCPASYANFYVANGVVLVPVFGAPADARALAILRELFSGREVVGIPSADLVVGLGALHCVTQQEPAVAVPAAG
jgi:agmatine deiminase